MQHFEHPRAGKAAGVLAILAVLLFAAGFGAYRLAFNSPDLFEPLQVRDTDRDVGQNTELAMSEDDAKYLQDVEHLGGFVLGDLTFPKISRALKSGDTEALAEFFSDEFTGSIFESESGDQAETPVAQLHSWHATDAKTELDRDGFVDALIARRRQFEALDRIALKIMLMHPVTRGDLTGAWEGTCKLIMAGYNTDGKLQEDVIVFSCRLTELNDETVESRHFIEAMTMKKARRSTGERFMMTDIGAEIGIDVAGLRDNWVEESSKVPFLTGGVFLADYDQDGRMDVLVTDMTGISFYRQSEDGKYADVTTAAGLPKYAKTDAGPILGAIFADFDGDGFEDLLLGSQIYRNVDGKSFEQLQPGTDTTLDLPAAADKFAVADFDRDGHLDLYVVGILSNESTKQAWIGESDGNTNQLWRNLGDWKFENVTESSGTVGGGSPTLAAVWFDANADGWPDLMTACEAGTNDYLLNQQDGTFKQGGLPEGYGGFSMGITVGDIDNDGLGDPYLANMYSKAGERIVDNLDPSIYDEDVYQKMRDFVSGNELYRNVGDGRFERVGQELGVADVGWAYGPGYADLNGDGFNDLYAPVGFQTVAADKPDG